MRDRFLTEECLGQYSFASHKNLPCINTLLLVFLWIHVLLEGET